MNANELQRSQKSFRLLASLLPIHGALSNYGVNSLTQECLVMAVLLLCRTDCTKDHRLSNAKVSLCARSEDLGVPKLLLGDFESFWGMCSGVCTFCFR